MIISSAEVRGGAAVASCWHRRPERGINEITRQGPCTSRARRRRIALVTRQSRSEVTSEAYHGYVEFVTGSSGPQPGVYPPAKYPGEQRPLDDLPQHHLLLTGSIFCTRWQSSHYRPGRRE